MSSNKESRPPYQVNLGRFERRLDHVRNHFTIGPKDCWLWAGTVMKKWNAFGELIRRLPVFPVMDEGTRKEKTVYARRWAWENWNGRIAQGSAVINVCGEELCVKPDPAHNRPMANGSWIQEKKYGGPIISEGVTVSPQSVVHVPSEEDFLSKK